MKSKRFNKDIIEVGIYFGAAFDHYTLWELGLVFSVALFCLFPT